MDSQACGTHSCEPDAKARLTPLLLTAEDVAASLAICRTKVYELLRNGELESVQIGSSRRIPASALAEYVDRLRTAAQARSDSWAPPATVLRAVDD